MVFVRHYFNAEMAVVVVRGFVFRDGIAHLSHFLGLYLFSNSHQTRFLNVFCANLSHPFKALQALIVRFVPNAWSFLITALTAAQVLFNFNGEAAEALLTNCL